MKNKKIGILTFHYVDNYGAVLQAWALRTVLNRFPGVNAEFINYIPDEYRIRPYVRSEIGISYMRKKRDLYERFLSEKCSISDEKINHVSGDGYDCCCVGSDQVWNMGFRENVTYEYLFPNLNDNVERFSYAASIGGKIEEKERKHFCECLSKFKSISVREEYSTYDLKQVGVSGAETVIDPTLLLEEKDYEELITEPKNKPDNYVFFFSYPIGEDMRRYAPFVNRLAIENGLNVLHSFPTAPVNLFFHDCGSMMYEGIGEFLWYIKNARVVVTTSYHGAIFGKMFHRPTYIICRQNGKERFEQLGAVLNLSESFVNDEWMARNWDFAKMAELPDENLEYWRSKSLSFLRRVVDE